MTEWYGLRPPALPPATDTARPDGTLLGLRTPEVDAAVLGDLSAEPERAPTQRAVQPFFSPSQQKYFVDGRVIDADDAQGLLEAEQLVGRPASVGRPRGDWVPIPTSAFAAELEPIKNPSLGTLFTKGVGRGADLSQLLLGRGLQLLGAEETGAGIVAQQAEDLRRTMPFTRRFTDIESGGDAIEWFVANLGEQVPNILESVAVAGAGAIGGTFTGGPGVGTAAGALAGLAGKTAFKQQVLAAVRKKVAGEVLDAAEKKVLRSAGALVGATAATYANSYRTGAADIYNELRDQGADPDDISAKMLALAGAFPYAAAESLPEFVLAGRIFGGIGARAAIPAGTSLRRRGAELLRRGAVGGAVGGLAEGGTEVAQESLLLGLTDQDFSDPENIRRLVDSFAAGAAIGAPIGAASNLRGRQPENLLNPGQNPDIPPVGGPEPTPQLGGPGPVPLLPAPNMAVGPARNVVYRPQTAIGQEGQLALPPPGAVLQVEGRPDFVVDEFGNIRAATADDTVVGVTRGFVPPTAPGTQGVLNIFPEGRTTTGELRGMMEQPVQPVALLQPEGVSGEVPTAQPDLRQDVLPLDTGLAPFRLEQPAPPAPTGTLAGNEQLAALQEALARRQAQGQQFAQVPPQVTPEVSALEQRLAESQPSLDVMGTEGRLIPEPQVGVTMEEAEADWKTYGPRGLRRKKFNSLRPEIREQWMIGLNMFYNRELSEDALRDGAARLNAIKKGEPVFAVFSGEITPLLPPRLYHGGRRGLTTKNIRIIREPGATKQGRKGRVYGGFYLTTNLEEARAYADMAGGNNTIYEVQIRPNAVVAQREGDITRLSPKMIEDYRNNGVDVVVGKDVRGRTEYVVINQNVITGLTDTQKSDTTGVQRAVEKPKAAKVPAKKQPAARGQALAERGRERAARAGTAKPAAQKAAALVQDTQEQAVQDVRRDPRYKELLGAITKAQTDEFISAKERREFVAELLQDGDFDLVRDTLRDLVARRKRAAEKRAAAPKSEVLKKKRPVKITKLPPGVARGVRQPERTVERAQAEPETVEAVTPSDMDYADLSQEISAARDAKEIQNLEARVLQDMIAKRKPVAEINRALIGFKSANKGVSRKSESQKLMSKIIGPFRLLWDRLSDAVTQNGEVQVSTLKTLLLSPDVRKFFDPDELALADILYDTIPDDIRATIGAKGFNADEIMLEGMATFYPGALFGDRPPNVRLRGVSTKRHAKAILHEAVHIALIERYGFLFRQAGAAQQADVQRLVRAFEEAQNRPGADRQYGMTNLDEFVAELTTNKKFQRWLKGEGLWQRIVDAVRQLLGLSRKYNDILSEVMDATNNLLDTAPSVDLRRGTALRPAPRGANVRFSQRGGRRVEEMIDGMPSSLRDPLRTITDTIGGSGVRTVARFGLRDQVLRLAQSLGIKSATRFIAAINARRNTLTRNEQPFLKWADAHTKLPQNERGVGPGTVSSLIQRMTSEDKWAFMPDYFEGDDRKALSKIKLDPELRDWYNGLSTDGQASVREAFRLNYQQLKNMQKAVLDNTASQFDALIETAKDDTAKEKLREEKRLSLDRYRTMLNMDPTRPYAPLRRNGDWVVVGRSQRLRDALNAEVKDFALIRKLEESADDYYVDFAETRAEAAKMARGIEDVYGKDGTQFFPKAQSEQNLYGGGDVMYAFQKLNALMQDLQVKDEMKQQVRNAVAQLQLQVMAANSARKGELRRRGIASGHVDMIQTTLSHGRSTSQFIASVSHNDKILEALRFMGQEVKTFGPDREAKQEVYNSIVEHYMAGLQPQPQNTMVDKITGFASVWMLLLSPSYYIQQAIQNLMFTMPRVAARYGYSDTTKAFEEAYKQVSKAWVDTGVTGQLNIDLIDEKYRPLAIFLSESGMLDVGLDREMGSLTAESGGSLSNPFELVVNKLRGLTRKIEAINRLSAGIAVYELSRSGNRGAPITYDRASYKEYKKDFDETYPNLSAMSERQYVAALEALDVIGETHGDYSYENASNLLRNPVGRVLFQFQKFRLIIGGMYVRAFYNAFTDKSLSAAERRVARRTLMYVSGHAAIAGGLLGSPAAAIFALIYNILSGDDEERGDLERDIREAVGDDTVANLLLRGVPSLAGVDLSGVLGLGNLLSVAPYADMPTDRETYAQYILSLTGPAVGGIGANVFDAVSLMSDGNYYKAMERLMPRGMMNASRALREQVEGETTRRGDVTTQAIDMDMIEGAWGLLGLQPIGRINRLYARDQFYKDERFYQDRAADIKRAYVDATADSDGTAINALRLEWRALQQARKDRGFKTQPMLDLIKAPREKALRERRTVGGVQFTPSTEGRARQITEAAGTAP